MLTHTKPSRSSEAIKTYKELLEVARGDMTELGRASLLMISETADEEAIIYLGQDIHLGITRDYSWAWSCPVSGEPTGRQKTSGRIPRGAARGIILEVFAERS